MYVLRAEHRRKRRQLLRAAIAVQRAHRGQGAIARSLHIVFTVAHHYGAPARKLRLAKHKLHHSRFCIKAGIHAGAADIIERLLQPEMSQHAQRHRAGL